MASRENVYLIDLGTGTDRGLLPLACGLIASYCNSIPQISDHFNIYVRMMDEGIEGLIDEIEDPAVVGISCYCWNFLGSVDLSKRLREKYPEVTIVWGGPSIPARPHRIKEFVKEYDYVDILVHNEGELTFANLLLSRLSGESLSNCAGITYCHADGSYITTPPRDRIQDFTNIPSPFLNGLFDDLMKRYRDYIVGALWETSRGCPFKCSFCDWGSALVNKVNRLPIERAIKEIEWVSNNKMHYVYATDANFGITVKRDLEIAEGVVEIASRNGYPHTLILNWTKNSHQNIVKIADTLFTGGITTNVTLSYQSFHEPTLKAIQRDNIKPAYLKKLKQEFHDKKCATYNELILGLPEETLDTFISGIDKGLSHNLRDQLSIYLCCILVNTDLKEDVEKYGIETRECAVGLNRRKFKFPRFGVDEIVVKTSTMSLEEWKRAYEVSFIFQSFYNLRVAFFVAVYLKMIHDIEISQFVISVIDTVDAHPGLFPIFTKAISHVRHNRQLILDSKASVSEVKGSDGVAFTPHEAMTFLLLNHIDETYKELHEIVKIGYPNIGTERLDEVMLYQKLRMPTFETTNKEQDFNTTIPVFFEQVSSGHAISLIRISPTTVKFAQPVHGYDTAIEFNRRRVSCGYNINIVDAIINEEGEVKASQGSLPLARNVNLKGSFGDHQCPSIRENIQ